MRHVLELAALLLLVSFGRSVIIPAPNAGRRAAVSLLLWCLGIGALIAILYSPFLSAWLVRIGIVFLAAYFGRWIIGEFLGSFSGPRLFESPDTAHLTLAAAHVSKLPRHDCRLLSRRMAREYSGDVALLGLVTFVESAGAQDNLDLEGFAASWDAACRKSMEKAQALVEKYDESSGAGRLHVANATFVAQALCLYEERSVARALSAIRLRGRRARTRIGKQLKQHGRHHVAAQAVGLVAPPGKGEETESTEPAHQSPRLAYTLWPALGLAKLGFRRRAAVLGVCEAGLLCYGIFALVFLLVSELSSVPRDFLWNASGGIFLCAGAWLHFEAFFALADFGQLAQWHEEQNGAAVEGT